MGFVSGGNGEALRLCHYRPRARRGGGGSSGGGGNDKGRLCHHRLHQDVPTEGWAWMMRRMGGARWTSVVAVMFEPHGFAIRSPSAYRANLV